MSLVIAHAGHWTGYIMFAPVLLFGGWMAWMMIKDRRDEAREKEQGIPIDKGDS